MLQRSAYGVINRTAFISLCIIGVLASGCRQKTQSAPPMATPSVSLSRDKVPLGSPIDITYKFVVANDASFKQDYRVMVHPVDPNEKLMWTVYHDPPVPTSGWK